MTTDLHVNALHREAFRERHEVIAYTDTTQTWKLGQSMHLAIHDHNGEFTPLNFGYGVLFAIANYENTKSFKYGATRTLINPWIFRRMDGSIGVVAQSMEGTLQNNKEVPVEASPGKLLYWTTTDLVTYEAKGLITVADGEHITKPQVSYEAGTYYITWEGENGEVRESRTIDFQQFTACTNSLKVRETIAATMSGASVSSVFSITEAEKDYLLKKLGEVRNIGIIPISDMKVSRGTKLELHALPKLTALYSDGSTAEKSIHWDEDALNTIDFNVPGSYTISGTVEIKEYAWPLITDRADPDIIFYNGQYYFIATDETLQERLFIRVSDTLEGLATAQDHLILNRNQSGDVSGLFWAPEFHVINDRLCILVAASTESAPQEWWKHVQCRVIELTGSDPTEASHWGTAKRVMKKDGITPLYNSDGITLDMTYFEVNGTYYYMWSQREFSGGMDSANMMIATVDPKEPARLTCDPVLIVKPQFGWDRQGEVNEGPYMIRRNDELFITFSGSNTDDTYAVGLLTANVNADLLNPESWKVTGYPILASNHVNGQLGPGHNAFTKDEHGDDVFVFHARPNGGARSAGLRTVHWGFDGAPILYMTPDRELLEELRDVTMTITIEDDAEYGSLLTYAKGEADDNGQVSAQRNATLYVAARKIGESHYTLLNSGKAIHYATSSYAIEPVGTGMMKAPSLFRKRDGSFGLIAGDNNASSSVYLFDSKDLLSYNNERLLLLNHEGIVVKDPFARYDNDIQAYRIRWTGEDNGYYETITDLHTIISVKALSTLDRLVVNELLPEATGPISEIKLTKSEYDLVIRKFSRVKNVGVESITITVDEGGYVELPEKAKILYSDGSSKFMKVLWEKDDVDAIDINAVGEYSVKGTVKQATYADPFVKYRADPHILKGSDGYYYFTGSYPINGDNDKEGYDRVVLRRSRTLEGLAGTVGLDGEADAGVEEIIIWDEQYSSINHRFVWAPEIHEVNGKWVVFFTTSRDPDNVWGIRPVVIACQGVGDPFKPENWDKEAQYCVPIAGDTVAFDGFSLDMTYFESGGTHYVAWAQYVGPSSILIATIDPDQPWRLTSKSVILSAPSYAWEKATDGNGMIDEGPAVIKNDGHVYLAFSASSVNWSYCIGVMAAKEGADLLDVSNWVKTSYPILATDDLIDQQGPGHNSFTVDEFNNPLIVYHARTPGEKEGSGNGGLGDPGRHARIKPVHFTANGGIEFRMTPEEELDPQYKNVTMSVVVKRPDEVI